MRVSRTFLLSALSVIAGAAMLCLPAIANGFPFLFFDTLHYYAAGDKIISLASGVFHHAPAATGASPDAPAAAPAETHHTLFSYIGGRSPYYSVLFFSLDKMFSAWAPAFAQTLCGTWLIWVYAKLLSLTRRAYFIILALMTLATALPWTATFLMPDVFGGYTILAAAALAFFWKQLTLAMRIGCFTILVAAMAFHTINLLLIMVALPLALGLMFLFKSAGADMKRAAGVFAAAIVLAIIANAAYPAVTKIALGKPLKAPPFLMARLLADGPGRDYLRKACATDAPYTACAFKDLPLDNGDAILWSLDPARGIYMASSEDTQHKLIDEQMRFALGVATHETIPQIGASLANWYYQLVSFGLNDLSINAEGWAGAAKAGAVDETLMPWLDTPANHGRFPLRFFTLIEQIAFCAALAYLAFRLTRRDLHNGDEEKRAMIMLVGFAIALIIFNAGIAGALSGVFHRYQARVVWVAPLCALLVAARYGVFKPR